MDIVRAATEHDFEVAVELLEKAVVGTPDRRGGDLFQKESRERDPAFRIRQGLVELTSSVLLAIFEDVAVGLALVNHFDQLGIIEELYVLPEARGAGIGEALLDRAVEWCRHAGTTGVDIQVLPGDRSAKNACERSGFSARALTMYRKL